MLLGIVWGVISFEDVLTVKGVLCNTYKGSLLACFHHGLLGPDDLNSLHTCPFERSIRDIMRHKDARNFDKPLGGKTILLGSDF